MIHSIIASAAKPGQVFGIDIIDVEDVLELLVRFSFNLLVVIIIVGVFYYPVSKRKDYLFTYIVLSIIVFLLCFLLDNVKLELGFALGLFAIFGFIRYRTNPIPIKEMTYLFLVIGVSVINALANKKVSYIELISTNFILILITFLMEKVVLLRHEASKTILYEKIDLIVPEKRLELLQDLETRTGIKVNRIEIGRIDFLRDTVRLKIFYYEDPNAIPDFDDFSISPNDDDDD